MNDLLELLAECGFRGRPNHQGELPLQFCCFHAHNRRSPSLRINVIKKKFYCWSCEARGSVNKILKAHGLGYFEGFNTEDEFVKKMNDLLKPDAETDPSNAIANFDPIELKAFKYNHPYLLKRGYSQAILDANDIGFDKVTASVTIPVWFNREYRGIIKRTVLPDYLPKYTYPPGFDKVNVFYEPRPIKGMIKEYTLYCEGSLDALKSADADYYSRAILGCNFSEFQAKAVETDPRQPIIALDNDPAGQEGLAKFLKKNRRLDLLIFKYPEGKKDLGDCSAEEIRQGIQNAHHSLMF